MTERDDDLLRRLGGHAEDWSPDAAADEGAAGGDEGLDIVDLLRPGVHGAKGVNGSPGGSGDGPADAPDPAREIMGPDPGGLDATLGGYIAVHKRPPAFEGSDGQPYTVSVDVDETSDPFRPYSAFLLFLRWAANGAGIMGHLESGDVAYGETPEDAHDAALELSLFEVRAELDAAIARRREAEPSP